MKILCSKCGSSDTVKNGRSASGAQRYYCATCQKTFQVEPHKPLPTKVTLSLEEIKRLRSEGLSLAKIGKLAGGLSRERVRQLLRGE